MRRIGTLNDGSAANRFCDYLLTLGIDAMADSGDGGPEADWDIWIRNEEHVDRARAEWNEFQSTPNAPKYQVEGAVAKIRQQQVAEHKRQMEAHRSSMGNSEAATSMISPRRIRQQSIPVSIGIIVISVIASFTSHFGNPRESRDPNQTTLEQKTFDTMSFVDRTDYYTSNEDAFASIKRGQWWRFITPMFLHGDEFHLAFNMLWVFFLGSTIERLHGSLFLLAIVLFTQTCGMMLQVMLPDSPMIPETLRGSPFAIGASGAVYGLFGFLWIRPYVDRGYPVHMVPMNVALMIGWLVVCLLNTGGNVANGAHVGGLLSGIFAAVVTGKMRR